MYFLRTGDHVLVDAYPTCWPVLYTGRLPRTAIAGTCGGRPTAANARSRPSHATSRPTNLQAEPSWCSRSSARRPTKYPGLSRFTVQPRPISYGDDFCAGVHACVADV